MSCIRLQNHPFDRESELVSGRWEDGLGRSLSVPPESQLGSHRGAVSSRGPAGMAMQNPDYWVVDGDVWDDVQQSRESCVRGASLLKKSWKECCCEC